MADPSLALHKALLARLSGLSFPVYDGVPTGASYPYATIESSFTNNADFLSSRADTRFVFVHVWTENLGQEQAISMMAEIDAQIHEQALPLDTGTLVSIRVEQKQTIRDSDNVTFNGRMTLRIITEH